MHFKITTKKNLYQLRIEKIKLGDTWTSGTMNRCSDNKFCIYLDYDFFEEKALKDEIKHFQEVYGLGDFSVFQSSEKRFHIICFTKLTSREFVELMINSSCDEAFKNIPRFYSIRNWVLRAFSKGEKDKPKYLYTLKNKTDRQESYAHFDFLKRIYPDMDCELQNSDGLKKTSIISYKTAERKKQKV